MSLEPGQSSVMRRVGGGMFYAAVTKVGICLGFLKGKSKKPFIIIAKRNL